MPLSLTFPLISTHTLQRQRLQRQRQQSLYTVKLSEHHKSIGSPSHLHQLEVFSIPWVAWQATASQNWHSIFASPCFLCYQFNFFPFAVARGLRFGINMPHFNLTVFRHHLKTRILSHLQPSVKASFLLIQLPSPKQIQYRHPPTPLQQELNRIHLLW